MLIVAIILGAATLAALTYWLWIRPHRQARKQDAWSAQGGLPPCTETCEAVEREGELVLHGCGHETHRTFKIVLWGQFLASVNQAGPKPLCADCLVAKIVRDSCRCALCGHAIIPGDPVALYVMDTKIFKQPHWITRVDDQVIGCLRMECCPSGGFFAGQWGVEGFKPAFKHGSVVAEVFATGQPILISSTDPDDHT